MRLKRRIFWRAVATVVVLVALSPVWGFEALYHYVLWDEDLPQLHEPTGGSPLMRDALWVVEGESSAAGIEALWVGNFFDFDRAQKGRGAVTRGASLIRLRRSGHRIKTLDRHLLEAALAVWLSRNASESQLKALFEEEVYFGRNAHGTAAAAHAYFRRPLEQLTPAQTALLAGMPQAPTRYDPALNPDVARKRRDFVLQQMWRARLISDEQFQLALNEPAVAEPREAVCYGPMR